jgi:hypothetical protein
MKHYKCEYCGCNLSLDKRGCCSACGAPSELHEYMCSCGMLLDENLVVSWLPIQIICQYCFKTFIDQITGHYCGDKHYPNGSISHVFETKGRECPHCHVIFNAHEFYHDLPKGTPESVLINTSKQAYGKL